VRRKLVIIIGASFFLFYTTLWQEVTMEIYLRDRNPVLVDRWEEIFEECPEVHVSCGDIFEEGEHLNVEAIVSPANSFGFMDGGIDFIYSEYFGWGIGDVLREYLWQNHGGELLVGQAVMIDMRQTNQKDPKVQKRIDRIPYLISAPTMRVPMDVSHTVNAYLAFIASLRLAEKNGIKSLLCPGLGTAVGKMPYDICAVQMYEAYKRYNKPRFFDVLSNAHRLHYSMMNAKTYFTSEYL
jgi:O-acetyl-ADP-ribose deacetylase (regulator of RNase III)